MNFNKFYFLKKTTFPLFFLFILSCESNLTSNISNPKTKDSIQSKTKLDPQAKKQEIYKEFEKRKNEIRQKMEPGLTEYLSIKKELEILTNEGKLLLGKRSTPDYQNKLFENSYKTENMRTKLESKKPLFLKRFFLDEYNLHSRDFEQGKISSDEWNKLKMEFYVNDYVARDILFGTDDTNSDTNRSKLYNDFVELYMIMYPD